MSRLPDKKDYKFTEKIFWTKKNSKLIVMILWIYLIVGAGYNKKKFDKSCDQFFTKK